MPTDVPDNSANPALVVDTPIYAAQGVALTSTAQVLVTADVSQYESLGLCFLQPTAPVRVSVTWMTAASGGFLTLIQTFDVMTTQTFYQCIPVLGAGVSVSITGATVGTVPSVSIWGMAASPPSVPFLTEENSLLFNAVSIAASTSQTWQIPPIIGPAHICVSNPTGQAYIAQIYLKDYLNNTLGTAYYYVGTAVISSAPISLPPYIAVLSIYNGYTAAVTFSGSITPG